MNSRSEELNAAGMKAGFSVQRVLPDDHPSGACKANRRIGLTSVDFIAILLKALS
jgi:hypothetical protein